MDLLVAGLIACVSLFYATVGQAGGTAFLAIMAFTSSPPVTLHGGCTAVERLTGRY
jgi:hypothetical protein